MEEHNENVIILWDMRLKERTYRSIGIDIDTKIIWVAKKCSKKNSRGEGSIEERVQGGSRGSINIKTCMWYGQGCMSEGLMTVHRRELKHMSHFSLSLYSIHPSKC